MISFGLVSIPIKIYTATAAEGVHFNQLHKKCGGRIKQKLYCPVDDEYVERNDIVKGFEVSKNQYVQFSEEELKALDAERFPTLDLVEFVPESSVDFIYIEKSQYIGPDKGGDKAFNLLGKAMRRMQRIAVGRYWARGKVQLCLLRPYKKGLIMHQVYYANEVRSYDDVDLGADQRFSDAEEQLADKLIEQLSTDAFSPEKFQDEYAARVLKAAEEKAAGAEVTIAPEQPAAQIIDLFEALKQSLRDGKGASANTNAASAKSAGKAAAKPAQAQTDDAIAIKGPRKARDKSAKPAKRKLG